MSSEYTVSHKRRKLEVAIRDVRRCRGLPYFDFPAYTDCEMPAIRGKDQRIDLAAQRKMIQNDAARYICEDGVAVEVDCEEEVASWVEGEAGDVLAMCKGQGMRFRAVAVSVGCPFPFDMRTNRTLRGQIRSRDCPRETADMCHLV